MSVSELNRMADRGAEYLNSLILADSRIDFDKYNHNMDIANVKPASAWCQALIDAFHGDNSDPGCYLPWQKTHDRVKLRPGELSVWAGTNGHGKSALLNLIALSLAAQSERVCIASLEMKPLQTLKRMVRQFVGVEFPTIQYIKQFVEWTQGRIWLYDQIGTVKTERMIAVVRYCISELRITHFVIDSLMKCGTSGSDENARQTNFVDTLSTLAKDTGTHIHLVAHSRKSDNEFKQMDKFDVAGSVNITNMADNLFVISQNKKKDDDDPDAFLFVKKQRNGEWLGSFKFYYHQPSFQLLPYRSCPKHTNEKWEDCRWYT